MFANIIINPELDPESATPLVLERMAQIDIMGLEFDGDNPEEPKTWIDTEDIEAAPDEMPNLDYLTGGMIELCKILGGKSRREMLSIYFQAVDGIRKRLREVETREQLYNLVNFAVDLDATMMTLKDWNEGFDTFEKLKFAFENAERNVKRLEAIAAEQARISEKARLYWLERSKVDNSRVPA